MAARFVYGVAALLAFAAAYACWCHAPLIWDGAYQFNATLIMQRPYFYLTRFHTFFLWYPTVWASRLTSNVTVLQSVYGLPFLLAPVVGLLLSWWMVHRHAPRLILWAIFGIAAAALPGQIFVINDSIFQQHMFWPIFMAVFVPLSWPKKLVLALLIPFQFVHPLGVPLFFAAAAGAVAVAWNDRNNRRTLLIRAAILGALCLLAVSKIVITNHIPALNDSYAREEAKWHTALDRWYAGVMGWPIRGLWLMWAAGLMALLQRFQMAAIRSALIKSKKIAAILAIAILIVVYRRHPLEMLAPGAALAAICLFILWATDKPNRAAGLIYLCAAAGSLCWIRWAADDRLWWKALDYRRWLGPLTAPFFMFAIVEASLIARGLAEPRLAKSDETPPFRGRLALLLGATFAIVLGMQCTIWRHKSRALVAAVERSPNAIVPVTDFPWIPGTCLDHWASGDYVTLMQGKTPHKLLMFNQQSIDDLYAKPPKFPHWDMYPYAKPDRPDPTPGAAGWFDFRPLLHQLANSSRPAMQIIPDRLDSKTTPN